MESQREYNRRYGKDYYHRHKGAKVMSRGTEVNCADCGSTFAAYTPQHRFCNTCSFKRDRARKAKWAREHGQRPNPRTVSDRRALLKEAALRRNAALPSRRGSEPSLVWTAEACVPFSYSGSKNHIWTMAGSHVFSRQESVACREGLATELKQAVGGRAVEGRLWIEVFVQKPDHRGDAVNLLDLISDAVKDATGVDDRWYSVLRLDWEIRKAKPMIWVRIGQEITEPYRVCSMCGRDLPRGAFRVDGRTSTSRECLECRRKNV